MEKLARGSAWKQERFAYKHWFCFAILILSSQTPNQPPQTCRGFHSSLVGQGTWPDSWTPGSREKPWLLLLSLISLSPCSALIRGAAGMTVLLGHVSSNHSRVQELYTKSWPRRTALTPWPSEKVHVTTSKGDNLTQVKSLIKNQSIKPRDC